MMLLKTLIKQQMKLKHISHRNLALKTGIPFKEVRDLIENMQRHRGVMNLEKIMMILGIFTFDDEEANKEIKKELSKFKKSKKDYIYKN